MTYTLTKSDDDETDWGEVLVTEAARAVDLLAEDVTTTRCYPRTAEGADAAFRHTARYADPITRPNDPIYTRRGAAHHVSRRDALLGIALAILIGIAGAAVLVFAGGLS